MQTLVVRPRESAAALHRRLLAPANARPDAGIDLNRGRDMGRTGVPVALMPLVAPVAAVAPIVVAGPPPWLEPLIAFNEALCKLNGVWIGESRISMRTIRMVVAEHYGVTVDDMDGPSRHRPYTRPRFIAMFLCSQLTAASMPLLGRTFGGRDHTTVLSALKRVREWMEKSEEFAAEVNELAAAIRRLHV